MISGQVKGHAASQHHSQQQCVKLFHSQKSTFTVSFTITAHSTHPTATSVSHRSREHHPDQCHSQEEQHHHDVCHTLTGRAAACRCPAQRRTGPCSSGTGTHRRGCTSTRSPPARLMPPHPGNTWRGGSEGEYTGEYPTNLHLLLRGLLITLTLGREKGGCLNN